MDELSSIESLFRKVDEIRSKEDDTFSIPPDYPMPPLRPRDVLQQKMMNEDIYRGSFVERTNSPNVRKYEQAKLARIRDLFGLELYHERDIWNMTSDQIADVLIRDAIKHNTREFLPDALMDRYDEVVSGCDGSLLV